MLHITVTLCVVLPVIDPKADLSELATCVAVHALAVQDKVLKVPAVEHVAVPVEEPEIEYPVLHVTMTA